MAVTIRQLWRRLKRMDKKRPGHLPLILMLAKKWRRRL